MFEKLNDSFSSEKRNREKKDSKQDGNSDNVDAKIAICIPILNIS